MSDELSNEIVSTLTTHYGATKVVVDNSLVIVYGVERDYAKLAVETLLTDTHEVEIEDSFSDATKCVLKLIEKDQQSS